jgi:hypothetical protein
MQGLSRLLTSSKKEEYRNHILLWEKSNLSQSAYCAKHNLRMNTFSYLRNKILSSKNSQELSTDKFVQVTPSLDTKMSSSSSKLIVNLVSGHQIELPIGIPELELSKIFAALGISRC